MKVFLLLKCNQSAMSLVVKVIVLMSLMSQQFQVSV